MLVLILFIEKNTRFPQRSLSFHGKTPWLSLPGAGASTAIQAAVGSSSETIFVDAEKGEEVMQETGPVSFF